MARRKQSKSVETLTHGDASRKNLPSAEHQPLMQDAEQSPVQVAYARRNRDLDPQLVWRGKDEQDWSELVVNAPPLYIQERVHPKALVDDLMRQSEQARRAQDENVQPGFADLFADFNGLPSEEAKTEFYRHDANWSNRMILGDSLQVMASLAEREGLRGKVQCIYIDPPYGIKFNSNFQWSTTSRDVRDGKADHITREPEQVKAFRDTWRDGIHSYLTYLRDRLTVARDLLSESGSVFVQIGDENVHRVRALMDEVFGEDNFIAQIPFAKTTGYATNFLTGICDYIIWYGKHREQTKYRQPYFAKEIGNAGATKYSRIRLSDGRIRTVTNSEMSGLEGLPRDACAWVDDNMTSQGNPLLRFTHNGKPTFRWYIQDHQRRAMKDLQRLERISMLASGSFRFIRYIDDFSVLSLQTQLGWI